MSAAAEIQPMFFDDDGGRDIDIQFDQNQFEAVTPYSEDLNDEYEKAQEQLRKLREQEEQIRQQAEELEELSRQEDEFHAGCEDVTRKLELYVALLDREANEAQKLAEECAQVHEKFESHLANLNMLRPETWNRADRKSELARALNQVDSAEGAIDRHHDLLETVGATKRSGVGKIFGGGAPKVAPASTGFSGNGSFGYWMKSGLAFSLPLILIAGIAYALFTIL